MTYQVLLGTHYLKDSHVGCYREELDGGTTLLLKGLK